MSALARRDLLAIIGSILLITLLAWYYLVLMALDMNAMAAMPGMPARGWDLTYFVLMFLMWAVMMAGMMLPSVVPVVLIYASVCNRARKDGNPVAATAWFVAGYLAMWLLFSFFATALQWTLDEWQLLSPMMMTNSILFGAALLILTGLYQWLPVKHACLQHCRSPVEFISSNWRKGKRGALFMGAHHGLYCVGCCWLLMSLLFIGGVMNLLWIAAIALFVLLEKLLPWGMIGGKLAGLMMMISGAGLLYTGW